MAADFFQRMSVSRISGSMVRVSFRVRARFRVRVRIRLRVRFRVWVRVRVRVRVRVFIKPIPLSRFHFARKGILFGVQPWRSF